MKEKKLTDEEIIKALECCINSEGCDCGNCPYNNNADCQHRSGEDLLDLIHRLQDEKRHLSEEYDRLGECFAKLKKRNAEQKAEIERLTEEKQDLIGRKAGLEYSYNQVKEKNAELQKQVDELKEENGKLVTIGNGFALERNNLREELDELKKSGNGVLLTSLYKKQADNHKRGLSVQRAYWKNKLQQVEKDTAKEIYKEIGKGDILVVQTQEYSEIEVVSIERLKEIIKSKGVEVE